MCPLRITVKCWIIRGSVASWVHVLFDTMLNIKKFFVVTGKNVSVMISSVLLSGPASSFNIPM